MADGRYRIPKPVNEPVLSYAPGTKEREELKRILKELKEENVEIALIIGGKEIKTGDMGECLCPHDHSIKLGKYHMAKEEHVNLAVENALEAREDWVEMEWYDRAAILLKAADLLAGPYRQLLNAATMLTQSKNVFQAEIDAACELIDFWRFNPYYMQFIYEEQPDSPKTLWDRLEYRPLEGFIFAVTPFNFVSIGGNLPTAPVLMGNVAIWKPASSVVYSNYLVMEILKEAGLPDGVINFIPGPGKRVGDVALKHPALAGVHFTGSTATFQNMWKIIGDNITNYNTYPTIVGETGGKDFIFVHNSADIEEVNVAIIRAAYEYQGQKCSAASRAYIPESLWSNLKERVVEEIGKIKIGDVEDFSNFMNAVIDRAAYEKICEYIEYVKQAEDAEIICGGGYDDGQGFFIEPTVVVAENPKFKTMEEEIFGPVITLYIYPDDKFEEYLYICDETSPYALTGSIFAKDRKALNLAEKILVNAAGNFYINDKPTAAVVGQQPFGGARKSGTNDKAGSVLNLIRWVSPRTIKENFLPPKDWRYPFMAEP